MDATTDYPIILGVIVVADFPTVLGSLIADVMYVMVSCQTKPLHSKAHCLMLR